MSLDIELLREAVQAEIDIAINRLAAKVSPLNILIAGLLAAVESDEALREQAVTWIGEALDAAKKAGAIDPDGIDYIEQALAMLKRKAVAKEYLQLARSHLGSASAETE